MSVLKKISSICRDINNTIDQVGVTRSRRFFVFCDIVYCCLRYKCTQKEYLAYQFYKYKNCYRKNFILHYHIKFYKSFIPITPSFNSKYENYNRFKNIKSREIIILPNCGLQTFLEFVTNHPKFVLKPDNARSGYGIEIFNSIDVHTAVRLFKSIKRKTLCEEYVYQHSEIAKLNPYSLNTIRVITIQTNNLIEIVSAAIKIGKDENSITDNMYTGGIGAAIDLKTGIVFTPGRDINSNLYFEHPITHTQIIGLKIPFWDEVKDTVINTHKIFNERPIIGWDIAIKEDSIEIIEVNVLPGSRLMQLDNIPKGDKIFVLAKF